MKRIRKIIDHPLFSGSAVMIGGSMIVNVINYIYHLVMGRILGPVNYGVLASLFSILYIVGIVPTSTSVAIVKFVSSGKNPGEVALIYRSIKVLVLKIALGISLLTAAASPVIANFLHIENVMLIILISPILFFSLITLVNQAASQGLLKFMGFVLPNLTASVVKICLGVMLIYLGFSVFGAIVGVLMGGIIAYFVSIPYVRKIQKAGKFKKNYDLKPFLIYSMPVFLQALAFTSIFTTDLILVKHFLAPFDAGIYAALSTLGKIIFFASSPISSVMFPVISGRNAKGENYMKVFWVSLALTFVVSGLAVATYYFFSDLAISILYGKEYLSASADLVWMGFFILVYTLAMLLVNFSLSLGKTRIIIFPVLAAVLQAVLIWVFHSGIREIIQVSLVICILMLFGEAMYLGYNRLSKEYAKIKS